MNRKIKRNSIYNRVKQAIWVVFRKDKDGNDTKETLAYLHPTRGYKGNKKYLKEHGYKKRKKVK